MRKMITSSLDWSRRTFGSGRKMGGAQTQEEGDRKTIGNRVNYWFVVCVVLEVIILKSIRELCVCRVLTIWLV